MKRLIAAFFLALSTTAAAQVQYEWDPASYEPVLVPLTPHSIETALPGANGSRWTTTFKIANTLNREVLLNRGQPYCNVPCGTESGYPALRPREVSPYPLDPFSEGGAVLNVERKYARNLSFNLRIADVSRSTQNVGTEVPVIREAGFLHAAAVLLDVPIRNDARVSLRIYDLTRNQEPHFRVRFLRQWKDVVLLERDVSLQPGFPAAYHGFPPEPGFIALIGIEHLPELSGQEFVRLEIIPLDPDPSFWAMASVTNNETQMTTIISPQ